MKSSGSYRRDKLNRANGDVTMKTPKLKAELRRGNRPDDQIDLSDIPEVVFARNAIRGKFYRPLKRPVSIRLDADVLSALRARPLYQSRINAILRDFIEIGVEARTPIWELNSATRVYPIDIRYQGQVWRLLFTRSTDAEIQSKVLDFVHRAAQPAKVEIVQNAIRQELDNFSKT